MPALYKKLFVNKQPRCFCFQNVVHSVIEDPIDRFTYSYVLYSLLRSEGKISQTKKEKKKKTTRTKCINFPNKSKKQKMLFA